MSAPLVHAVLFDLDGTLLDTAPDLVSAANAALAEKGFAPLSLVALRPHVSAGAGAILLAGLLQHGGDPALSDTLLPSMLKAYREDIARHTRLFAGMDAVLDALEARGLPWGVVTNKPAWLTDPLLEALNLKARAACVVSGDTVAEKKPHPLPLLEAARRIGHEATACVYLGDAGRDIEAGQRAGMCTLAALYGYLCEDDDPHAWGADDLIAAPGDLLPWLERHATWN
jgi:N-acetyl-D-muramate 6-phosphate phosphatase